MWTWLKTIVVAATLALGASGLAQARDIVPFRGYEAGTVVVAPSEDAHDLRD